MTLALPRSWLTRGESVYRTPGPETPPTSIQNTSTTPPRYKGEDRIGFMGTPPETAASGARPLWTPRRGEEAKELSAGLPAGRVN